MKKKQLDLFDAVADHRPGRKSHGGSSATKGDRKSGSREKLTGKRKLMRPLDRKHPLLLTMRAEAARGKYSLLNARHRLKIREIIQGEAKRNGIRIHRFANVGNHLHMMLSLRGRESFQRFLKAISGWIAREVTGARKGKPFGKFWDALAHSRVLTSRREVLSGERYVEANEIEAAMGRHERECFLQNPKTFRHENRGKLVAAGILPGSA